METDTPLYDERYLAGIVLFNRHDFFEAHEVWEALWLDRAGPEKRFVQGLIQAAVALVHFSNGNLRGAAKLYRSGRAYMEAYGTTCLGLDIGAFWQQMARCFAAVLEDPGADRSVELNGELVPTITLQPPPDRWPDPAHFLEDED